MTPSVLLIQLSYHKCVLTLLFKQLRGVWFAEGNSMELEFIKEFGFEQIGMEFDRNLPCILGAFGWMELEWNCKR